MNKKQLIVVCITVVLLSSIIFMHQFYTIRFNMDGVLFWVYNRSNHNGFEVFVGKYYFEVYKTGENVHGGIAEKRIFLVGKEVE